MTGEHSPNTGETMSKIVTAFFERDEDADKFAEKNRHDYYMHVETVSSSKLDRTIKLKRYMNSECVF